MSERRHGGPEVNGADQGPAPVVRVRYQEDQLLRTWDLEDEQAYRIAMRRRHNVGAHGWGVVTGPAIDPDAWSLGPGMALDGYGRELVVPQPMALPPSEQEGAAAAEAYDVWLLYDRVAEDSPPRGRRAGGSGRHDRWRETRRVRLTPAPEEEAPGRRSGISGAALGFGPEGFPSDDPEQEWPVYLGRLKKEDSERYTFQAAGRPQVRLAGAAVTHPAEQAQIRLGGETAEDAHVFAVAVEGPAKDLRDRIAITRQGRITIRGDVRLESGKLVVHNPGAASRRLYEAAGSGTESASEANGLEFLPMPMPPQARSWSVYHTVADDEKPPVHQLRLEILDPGDKGEPTRYLLSVASWPTPPPNGAAPASNGGEGPAKATFQRGLTVAADGRVDVKGNIVIGEGGTVTRGPIRADPDDPLFLNHLLQLWLKGLAAGKIGLQTSTLDLEVLTVAYATPTLTYTVRCRNTAEPPITDIVLYESVIFGDRRTEPTRVLTGLTLGPKEQTDLPFTSPSSHPTKPDRIIITGLGFGVGGSVVTDTDDAEVPA